jgi:glycosyltransferase involved in cell wall biosynthesis
MEPLGRSQVLNYLSVLSHSHNIYLISFEKSKDVLDAVELSRIEDLVDKKKIKWVRLRYHKYPTSIATLLDIIFGLIISFWIVVRYRVRIIHARSYVPSVIALLLKKILNVYFIFDMRGFWADERIDGGLWKKNSRLFRISKWFERHFFINADYIVSLTNAAVTEITRLPYLADKKLKIKVITTCTDLNFFRPKSYSKNDMSNGHIFTVGYVGSVGVWYLFDETLRCFSMIRKYMPEARLQIFNKGDHDYIHKHIKDSGLDVRSVTVTSGNQIDVVNAMQSMDVGIFIIKQCYSKIASAPTKLGEFLGCGVPCLCNTGVGDVDAVIGKENVGVVLNNFSDVEIRKCVVKLLELIQEKNIKKRCRNAALKNFSLNDGVKYYDEIYSAILNKD